MNFRPARAFSMIGMVISLAITAVLVYLSAQSLLPSTTTPSLVQTGTTSATTPAGPISSVTAAVAQSQALEIAQAATTIAALQSRTPNAADIQSAIGQSSASQSIKLIVSPGQSSITNLVEFAISTPDGTSANACVLLPTASGGPVQATSC